jgi:glycosyltransferase involved in cell wall biosynthesis
MPEVSGMVSVLVANYNYGRFLGTCLDSVLAQDYRDIEVIVVDDASTDDSGEVLATYAADSRVRVIRNEWNLGQAASMNCGFAACSGEYVAFLDSDDLWLPNKLSRCVERLVAMPELSFVQHAMTLIDDRGKALANQQLYCPVRSGLRDGPAEWRATRRGGAPAIQTLGDFDHSFYPTSGIVIRRAALESVFPLPELFRICADVAFVWPLAISGKTEVLPERLGEYRLHDSNGYFMPSRWYARREIWNHGCQHQFARLVQTGLCDEGERGTARTADELLWQVLEMVCGAGCRDVVLCGAGAAKQPVPALSQVRVARCADVGEAPAGDVLVLLEPREDAGRAVADESVGQRYRAVVGWTGDGALHNPSAGSSPAAMLGVTGDGHLRFVADRLPSAEPTEGFRLVVCIWSRSEDGLPDDWLADAVGRFCERIIMFGLDCQGYGKELADEIGTRAYMERSLSWRITGWLRRLRSWLKGQA